MVFAVIVPARMGVSPFPGKLLHFLGEQTALVRCLDRCAEIPGVDEIVCMVPDSIIDDPVAELARRAGYRVSRSDEPDPLARYSKAARDGGADLVMRIRSDCPFIDPQLCGRVRDLYLAAHEAHGVDYACNNMPAQFPRGLDCEVFAADRLHDAAWLAGEHERERVTGWLRDRPDILKACLAGPGAGLEELRWLIEHPEDVVFARAVYDDLGERAATASWVELAALCLRRPDLVEINAQRAEKSRAKRSVCADLLTTPTRFALAA